MHIVFSVLTSALARKPRGNSDSNSPLWHAGGPGDRQRACVTALHTSQAVGKGLVSGESVRKTGSIQHWTAPWTQ